MLKKRFATASQLDGVMDLERLHSGPSNTLDGKRFRFFAPDEPLPAPAAGLWVNESRRLAIIMGRAHNRPQAPSASQSVYRHGGFSFMEMLTPWLVLGPVGSA